MYNVAQTIRSQISLKAGQKRTQTQYQGPNLMFLYSNFLKDLFLPHVQYGSQHYTVINGMSLTSIDLSSSHCLYHVTFAIFRLNMLLEDYQTFSVFLKFSLPLLPENLSFTTSSINFLSSFKVELYLSKPNVKQNGTYCELSANRLNTLKPRPSWWRGAP